MKLSSKSIISSSPSRLEKFQPPPPQTHPLTRFSRFSRSNGGNRSRGRSRSNTMFSSFIRKKNNNATSSPTEPSSPKVTCIGQIRVKKPTTAKTPNRSTCKCIQDAILCSRFFPKPNLRRFLFLLMGCHRNSHRKQTVSEEEENRFPDRYPDQESGEKLEREEESDENSGESRVFSASTPPKNALLLMRCRSEPHRASSALTDRFWTEPKKEDGASTALSEQQQQDQEEEKMAQLEASSGPLILTRCKSEPSSRAGRLLLEESCTWKKKRRLAQSHPFTDSD